MSDLPKLPPVAQAGDGTPEGDVLEAIKDALKRPRQLSREEVIDFISRPFYMGSPKPIPTPAGKRGPKNKRTQYDVARDRRKELYHRLVRLPGLRLGTTNEGYVLNAKILEIASRIPMKCRRSKAVIVELDLLNLPCPDISNIRKLLRKNDL